MVKILLPPSRVVIRSAPVIFLAGPILGGGDWQSSAIDYFEAHGPRRLYVASPSTSVRPDLQDRALDRVSSIQYRLSWERRYLETAASGGGCILFWLPEQAEPMEEEKIYGRDTRGELGEWRGRMKYEDFHMVIGGEPGFDGYRVIQRNTWAVDPSFIFQSTLEDTCQAALTKILAS